MKIKKLCLISVFLFTTTSVFAQERMIVLSPGQAANGVYCSGPTSTGSVYAYTCDCHKGSDADDSQVDARVQVQAPQGDINAAMDAAQARCERLDTPRGLHAWNVLNCT